jgi:hypothetical protein
MPHTCIYIINTTESNQGSVVHDWLQFFHNTGMGDFQVFMANDPFQLR